MSYFGVRFLGSVVDLGVLKIQGLNSIYLWMLFKSHLMFFVCFLHLDSIVDKKEEIVTDDAPKTETETATTVTTETATATPAEGATVTDGTAPATEAGVEAEEDEEDDDEEEEEDEDLTKNDEQVKDEAESEEISSLQRAWEMFELAKLVYSKHSDSADANFKNKRVAECLLKLGEISIEQEVYEQAIVDIGESIKLQEAQEKEARDERMLAESFYQWGLAQQFQNLLPEAAESFQKSMNIIQLRVEKLKGKLTTGPWAEGDADAELEKNTLKEEIAEMEALVPEMAAKLEEVTAPADDSAKLIQEAKECMTVAATNGTTVPETVNGDVKDITSLVKSKRKLGATDEEEASVKKTRLSDAPNGTEEEKMETPVTAEEAPAAAVVTTTPEITA